MKKQKAPGLKMRQITIDLTDTDLQRLDAMITPGGTGSKRLRRSAAIARAITVTMLDDYKRAHERTIDTVNPKDYS